LGEEPVVYYVMQALAPEAGAKKFGRADRPGGFASLVRGDSGAVAGHGGSVPAGAGF